MSNTFLGRTIDGEIPRYTSGPVQQAPQHEFLEALDALLATPGVEAVRWQQYTPYFNDGEACEFNAYSALVKIVGSTADDDMDEYLDGFKDSYELYDYADGKDEHGRWVRKFGPIGSVDGPGVEAIHAALEKFESVIRSGKHDVILNEKFGDPAEVTATTEGFVVEYYEHD